MHRAEQPQAVGEVLSGAETSLRSGHAVLSAQTTPAARAPLWRPDWKSEKAIDRLFQRLTYNYGRSWTAQFDAPSEADGLLHLAMVKAEWGSSLAPYSNEVIGKALEAAKQRHAEWPPKLPQFMELCKAAVAATPEPRALPKPRPAAEKVESHLSRMREALSGSLPPREAQAAREQALERMDHKMPDPRLEVNGHG